MNIKTPFISKINFLVNHNAIEFNGIKKKRRKGATFPPLIVKVCR